MSRLALLSVLVLVAGVPFGGVAKSPQSMRPTPDKQILLTKARQGDVNAQFWLGTGYEQGWFGKPDHQQALMWLGKAAKRGDADAQNCLGKMYENGEGVSQDYIQAAKWYRRAAEHVPDLGGAGQGRNNLGVLYLIGHGVPQDVVRAYMWFRLAGSEANLSQAKAQMTADQIREAERMAADWIGSHQPAQ